MTLINIFILLATIAAITSASLNLPNVNRPVGFLFVAWVIIALFGIGLLFSLFFIR